MPFTATRVITQASNTPHITRDILDLNLLCAPAPPCPPLAGQRSSQRTQHTASGTNTMMPSREASAFHTSGRVSSRSDPNNTATTNASLFHHSHSLILNQAISLSPFGVQAT
ncbi:hypothetical protein A7P94_00550 [Eikenella sp. NML01-A-086]|nr:hypothetical protein A7P94_00550 [Eikenella sp. NML01-A-086]OAM41311.1 hypothetical protein A7Q02_08420 [Eikenella sp. NML97-A-109]